MSRGGSAVVSRRAAAVLAKLSRVDEPEPLDQAKQLFPLGARDGPERGFGSTEKNFRKPSQKED